MTDTFHYIDTPKEGITLQDAFDQVPMLPEHAQAPWDPPEMGEERWYPGQYRRVRIRRNDKVVHAYHLHFVDPGARDEDAGEVSKKNTPMRTVVEYTTERR